MKIYLSLLLLLLSSCATLVTKRNYKVRITAHPENAKILICDSVYQLPAVIKLKRNKTDLHVTLMSDSTIIQKTIKPTFNPWFLFGNLMWLQLAPIGYVVDFTNPKRFSYGKNIHIDLHDTSSVMRIGVVKKWHDFRVKKFPKRQGSVLLTLSIPFVNQFYQQPQKEPRKNNTGFLALPQERNIFTNLLNLPP